MKKKEDFWFLSGLFKQDFKRMVGTAKGFAVFGGLYALFECQIEQVQENCSFSFEINIFYY